MINLCTYDIESFPNFFSLKVKDRVIGEMLTFEVSWRKNQIGAMLEWLQYWKDSNYYMVGFNNLGYDYPMLHEIMTGHGYNNAASIYTINERIINTPWELRFTTPIKPYEVLIPQIDLFKIHHFDNDARRTSLKQIEFAMRIDNISESKYPFGVPLPETDQAADETLAYNDDDVSNTDDFLEHSMSMIDFRLEMSEKYNKNFLNHNDTKIGKDYFILMLQKAGVKCFDNNYKPIQTYRDEIKLNDCIFPHIEFHRPEFQSLLKDLRKTKIYETKGALKVNATLDGFQFDFGLGGIHGSVKGCKFVSDEDHIIIDADVKSYYPDLAIQNNLFPAHLSDVFCHVYKDVFDQRQLHKKGTTENKALKLALNGVYGDSNSVYSPFYDPQYTMTVTLNGQLLLCKLAEELMTIPGLVMIQINTDGLTVKLPRRSRDRYDEICQWWEQYTKLTLEYVEYERMIIRDVNNYIAIPYDGKPKFKGAYVHSGAHLGKKGELDWHKNHSALIVKMAASKAILENIPVSHYIRNHKDIYDFFKFIKVGRKDGVHTRGEISWAGTTLFSTAVHEHLQKNNRYLVTNSGHTLIKTMPSLKRRTNNVDMVYPKWRSKKLDGLNKNLKVTNEIEYLQAKTDGYVTKDGGTYKIGPTREFEVEKGYLTTVCNMVITNDMSFYDIDYDYYINEAEKLVHAMVGANYD